MPITVVNPTGGAGFIDDLAGILEFLSFDAVLLAYSSSFLSLQGTYGGLGTNILVTGTGFTYDTAAGYITAGSLDSLLVSSEAVAVTYTD
ncbi:MAG: hypothetical protein VXW58_05980, partial [Pseudomonadota bacterium]|nr:hypothetical protein [Pseudomonadota bacterium]